MDSSGISNPTSVSLRKVANVSLGDDMYMIVIYYYRSERTDRSKSFYRCSLRVDSREDWTKLREGLLKDNPARTFTTDMIGMDDVHTFLSHGRAMNKTDFYRWLGSRFSGRNVRDLETFMEEEFSPLKAVQYLRKYRVGDEEVDISEPGKFPKGKWFTATREKKPRKKYGTIVY